MLFVCGDARPDRNNNRQAMLPTILQRDSVTKLKFALVGTGFMGKAHAIALRSVATVFPDVPAPVCEYLVDTDRSRAEGIAASWGFNRASTDWLSACTASDVDVVDICTPNHLHKEMALAAIAALADCAQKSLEASTPIAVPD